MLERAEFKDRLKEAMDILELRATDLAKRAGVPKSQISQYLSGYAKNPNAEKIFILSKALGCSPQWLMGYDVPFNKPADAEVPTYNPQVMLLIECFSKMSEQNQENFIRMAKMFAEQDSQDT